jgi:hypothetical protein
MTWQAACCKSQTRRFQAGDVPELDVLKARLATSQSDVERQVGQRRVIRARQQLNIIMGRKPEEVIEIPRLPAFLRDQNKAVLDETQRMQLLPDFSQEVAPLESYLAKGTRQPTGAQEHCPKAQAQPG